MTHASTFTAAERALADNLKKTVGVAGMTKKKLFSDAEACNTLFTSLENIRTLAAEIRSSETEVMEKWEDLPWMEFFMLSGEVDKGFALADFENLHDMAKVIAGYDEELGEFFAAAGEAAKE